MYSARVFDRFEKRGRPANGGVIILFTTTVVRVVNEISSLNEKKTNLVRQARSFITAPRRWAANKTSLWNPVSNSTRFGSGDTPGGGGLSLIYRRFVPSEQRWRGYHDIRNCTYVRQSKIGGTECDAHVGGSIGIFGHSGLNHTRERCCTFCNYLGL